MRSFELPVVMSLIVRPCPERCTRRGIEAGNLRRRLHRALCDSDGAILDLNKRFGPARLRRKRYERECSLASLEQLPLLRCMQECEVNRILVRRFFERDHSHGDDLSIIRLAKPFPHGRVQIFAGSRQPGDCPGKGEPRTFSTVEMSD